MSITKNFIKLIFLRFDAIITPILKGEKYMNDIMNYVGLANIFEKKELIINKEKKRYYQKLEPCFCFHYNFNNEEISLVVLNGSLTGKTINSNSVYKPADFKTLNELCNQNGNVYNYNKFISSYRQCIGDYYTYNSDIKRLSKITDQNLLQKIQNTTKDFDDTILNNNTDISKIYSSIKKTIISQDEQIMQILTSLFKNQKVINLSLSLDMIAKLKENIIVYGSTGTGKTEILKRIANIYNVPIVIADATSFSETGYIGGKITDMLENLYLTAGKDIEKAQKGILVIDEFDKLAETTDDRVSRTGVQRSLLKLLDGSILYFGDKKFDTSRLSVVALGAFTGIVDNDDYSNVSSIDFVNYGIMRELMGRFSNFVAMNSLSKEDLKKILIESDFSPLNTYRLLFESMNIEFSYNEDFIDYIAEKALALNSGARSLKTVFDDTISSAMFRIFAGEYSAIHLTKPTNEERPYILTKKR